MSADLGLNAKKWFKEVPQRQRYTVTGYIRELRSLFPDQPYYNQSPVVTMFVALYQVDIEEKLLCYGNPQVSLNRRRWEAKIGNNARFMSSGRLDTVYGAVLINPKLDAQYKWNIRIFNRSEQPDIRFVGQPDEVFSPRPIGMYYDDSSLNKFDWEFENRSSQLCYRSNPMQYQGSWGSGDTITIVVNTKKREISWSKTDSDDSTGCDGPEHLSMNRWEAMRFHGKDPQFDFGDDDDDIDYDGSWSIPWEVHQNAFKSVLDWSTPMRLAISMPGNGWIILQDFQMKLLDHI